MNSYSSTPHHGTYLSHMIDAIIDTNLGINIISLKLVYSFN